MSCTNVVGGGVEVVRALFTGLAIPAKIGRNHPQAGLTERRDLVPPRPPIFWKPMKQHDGGAGAGLEVVQAQAGQLDEVVTHVEVSRRHGLDC